MANIFYTPTSNPVTRSTSSSEQIRNEFALISRGFDRLPTALSSAKGFSRGEWQEGTFTDCSLFNCSTSGLSGTINNLSTSTVHGLTTTPPGSDAQLFFYAVNSVGGQVVGGLGVGGGAHYFVFDRSRNVIFGDGVNPTLTNATQGFFYINRVNGTPTGVPSRIYPSSVPMIYDATNNRIGVYNGSWRFTAALT